VTLAAAAVYEHPLSALATMTSSTSTTSTLSPETIDLAAQLQSGLTAVLGKLVNAAVRSARTVQARV
jgi:hypothetical protein